MTRTEAVAFKYTKNLLNKVNRYLEKNENICELKKSAKQDGG